MQVGLNGGDAISGGRMRCLPGFSGMSMTKPFPECVRDLWNLLDGPNMLNLSFDGVLNAIKQLKKSSKAWVHESKPGKYFEKMKVPF